MDETVLTSNLKKMPKKLLKELTDDMLALFPKGKDGQDPSPSLVTSWLKVYSTIKHTNPAGNVGFNIPIDEDHHYQLSINAESWTEGEEVRLKLLKPDGDDYTTCFSTILTRATLLQLHNFIATAIAHLPNE